MDNDTEVQCVDIHNVNGSEQCHFYNATKACHDFDGKLDYMFFIYCTFQEKTGVGVFLCVLWLLLLFVSLGVTADDFLCPSLVVITKTLHLSQNIAGVTFLAFGNGAPDIFSSVAGIEQSRPQLVIGTLFGAGIFVTSVVAGSIIATKPFHIMERPFLRDTVFYLCAAFWAFLRFYNGQLSLAHSIGFIVLYILYIIVVIISRVIYHKYLEKKKKKEEENNTEKQTPLPTISLQCPVPEPDRTEEPKVTFKPNPEIDDPEAEGVVLRRFSFRGSISVNVRRRSSCHAHHEHVLKTLAQSTQIHSNPSFRNGSVSVKSPTLESQLSKTSMSSLLSRASSGEFSGRLTELFRHLFPIDIESWRESQWLSRVFDIVKAPSCFLLILTVPVVDYENEKNHWCRLLNSLHGITVPMFMFACVGDFSFWICEVFPVWAVVLLASSVVAVAVFFTSKEDEPPCYHWAFGYVGFVTSVMWVYLIASEIVSLLRSVGIVFKLSDTILGLTVLAWGNSIGDFISNLSVARQGYPRMGISACYGGPLLNLLLGIGIPYTVMIVKEGHPLQLEFTKLIGLLYGTLTVVLLSSIITMTALRFRAHRYFGIFLVCSYVVFVVVAILLETKVI